MEKDQEVKTEEKEGLEVVISSDVETDPWPFEKPIEDIPSYDMWKGECENPF